LGIAHKCGKVNPLQWDPYSPPLDNWVANGNTDINKIVLFILHLNFVNILYLNAILVTSEIPEYP